MGIKRSVTIDDQLLAKAQRITGVSEKAALAREGLRALIERSVCLRRSAVSNNHPVSTYARVTAAELDDVVPVPDIKINKSDGPLTLTGEDTIQLSLHLDNNARTDFADWWLVRTR